MKPAKLPRENLELTFTEAEVSVGNQEIPAEVVLSPIAQTISGHVTVLTELGPNSAVELVMGTQSIGSVPIDPKHNFEFHGILPGEYEVKLSNSVGIVFRNNIVTGRMDAGGVSSTGRRTAGMSSVSRWMCGKSPFRTWSFARPATWFPSFPRLPLPRFCDRRREVGRSRSPRGRVGSA